VTLPLAIDAAMSASFESATPRLSPYRCLSVLTKVQMKRQVSGSDHCPHCCYKQLLMLLLVIGELLTFYFVSNLSFASIRKSTDYSGWWPWEAD
jgi:hypothetical protein